MTAPVTNPGCPRHWDTELGGIRWIPRMIDKSRMQLRGELGSYVCGNSPVDKGLLKRLNMTTNQFVDIVAQCPDDEAVLAALRARGYDEASLKRWSDRFHETYKMFIPLWEADEGYVPVTGLKKSLMAGFKKVEGPLMAAFRKISPAP